jgi:hypothetical protein
MTAARLPAGLEVSALIRLVEANGGFAMVLRKGEPEGGSILIVLLDNQNLGRLYERPPHLDGTRKWTLTKSQDADNKQTFEEYLARRMSQDPDLWVIELTIADGERLILNLS